MFEKKEKKVEFTIKTAGRVEEIMQAAMKVWKEALALSVDLDDLKKWDSDTFMVVQKCLSLMDDAVAVAILTANQLDQMNSRLEVLLNKIEDLETKKN